MSTEFPCGAQLAVVSQSGCALHFFDLPSCQRSAIVPMLAEPHEVRFDPVRRLLLVSHTYRSGYFADHDEKSHEVTVVDVDTHEIVRVIDIAPEHAPHALALAGDLIYVSVEEGPNGPGGLIAVDPVGGEVTSRHSADASVPHWAVVAPDGRTAYTTNKTAPYVSVVDLTGGRAVRRIPVVGSEELALSPSGHRLYVATPTTGTAPIASARCAVKVIDTQTLEEVASIPVPEMPSAVHVTDDGMLLVGSWPVKSEPDRIPFDDGFLSVFDTRTTVLSGRLRVGVCPIDIASVPGGGVAFVANLISGTVTVVDLAALAVSTTVVVDVARAGGDLFQGTHNQGAHGLAYIPPIASSTPDRKDGADR
ncbi:hypothetical protein P0W64_07040 [Tsukamurella sp. 8F]|uniref:hypothetical protein n=1 Tax=unclassified Tsukamurella TaxID=2633480 RepID=UPI0023BA3A20|nr:MULTISPECIES: hypothetical protein [unclassified Tsukamurella]MDF0530211.1 hypothetical protein [Tsukamurella sp. 8J]MDF0586528.1 hypothetical protein [Tsukamurella sp. 8F]